LNTVKSAYDFGPARRLRSHAQFVLAQANGRRMQGRYFLFLVYDRSDEALARLGIVASRKLGAAPLRNRIKRLCREAFRLAPELLPAGLDVVVIPRRQAAELGLSAVAADFHASLFSPLARVRSQSASKIDAPPLA
jgi:ribonuclease P protein component